MGDGALYFYLQDVIVLPDYQGKGIGYAIAQKLVNHVLAVAPPGAFVGLMTAPGVASIYEKFGVTCRSQDMPGMALWVGLGAGSP